MGGGGGGEWGGGGGVGRGRGEGGGGGGWGGGGGGVGRVGGGGGGFFFFFFFLWQHLIDKLPKEIVLRILITPAKTATGEPSMKAAFQGLYLGRIPESVKILDRNFPELKVKP